jgi:TrmH family RNA methyltransferase
MKTMGLRQLYLVCPARFPTDEARSRASGGTDVLDEAVVTRDVVEALEGCELVLGTTARDRSVEWPVISPSQAGRLLVEETRAGRRAAVVFGTERSGLSNQEVEHCHKLIRIPTVESYSSLNLAAAVQIIAYEIFRQSNEAGLPRQKVGMLPKAEAREMHSFYRHLQQALHDFDFVKTPHPPVILMRKLIRLFNRARPDREELNILHGILTAAQESLKQ